MAYSFTKETGLYKLDTAETVATAGKTLIVTTVIYVTSTAGDDLKLTDGNDKLFVEIKAGQYIPAVIPFSPARKLDGLKVATIDGGAAYIYVQQ